MFDSIIGTIRKTVTDALPTGVFAEVLYDAVESDMSKITANARFAGVQMEFTDPIQMTIGARPRFEQEGILIVRLYEPDGKGDGTQLTHASTICDNLRSKKASGTGYSIIFQSPGVANGIKEGDFHVREVRANLRIRFYPSLAS